MRKHPDADAFVREHLRQPANATTRLAFADWLEETGTPSNVAWAHYIRLCEEVDRVGTGADPLPWLLCRTDPFVAQIRAKLTLAARSFVRNPEAVLQLLPAPNVTVRFADYEPPIAVVELVPESLARENLVLPLALQGRTLFAATADPHNPDAIEKLGFILDKNVVFVSAARESVLDVINHLYGQAETESVDSVSYESPLVGLAGDDTSFHLARIFYQAFSQSATGFALEMSDRGCTVRYNTGETVLREEEHDTSVFHRLFDHLLAQRADAEYVRGSSVCTDLDIPLLSNRRFPVTLERPLGLDRWWLRLRFRW